MACARGSDRFGAVLRSDLVEHAMRLCADPVLVAQLAETDGDSATVAELLGRLLGEVAGLMLTPGSPMWAVLRGAEMDRLWRSCAPVMPGSLAAQLPDLCALTGVDACPPAEGTWFDVWLSANARCQAMLGEGGAAGLEAEPSLGKDPGLPGDSDPAP